MKNLNITVGALVGVGIVSGIVAMLGSRPVMATGGGLSGKGADCCSIDLSNLKTDKGLVEAPPHAFCVTQEQYLENIKGLEIGLGDAPCPDQGPADDPAIRNLSIPTETTPIKTYRLYFHVFRENGGANPAATQADVDNAVVRLNAHYAPWRMQFVYETRFVNSTKYRYLDRNTETTGMKNSYNLTPSTKLNVYVVDTGGVCWGTFPFDPHALGAQGGIVMDDTWFGISSPLVTILTHEVGHCVGLWHTFHGVTEVTQCGDCYEPVGRTAEVGDLTGDRCSDTEPTTNHNQCNDPAGTDPCSGNAWSNTPWRNYMSYSNSCAAEFTPQQAGRMHRWTTDALTGWLVLPMPPAVPGSPSLSKLGSGVIGIAWTDNSSDEDQFEVQREQKSGSAWLNQQIVATLPANVASTTDSPGSGTFRYRVRASNANGNSNWSGWTQIKN